jgi:cellulose synthase/poly-beta-1,6-N-acetylglucosamine synthase-like glycosyltransferase
MQPIRLRNRGWRVVFAENAICYTDVPESFWVLARQRLRWERDSIWVRYRKHWRTMSPFHRRFRLGEAIHQWDFLLFSVIGGNCSPL